MKSEHFYLKPEDLARQELPMPLTSGELIVLTRCLHAALTSE